MSKCRIRLYLSPATPGGEHPSAQAFARVKSRLVRYYPAAGWTKHRDQLTGEQIIDGTLPEIAQYVRSLALAGLGDEAPHVEVSVTVSRGVRPGEHRVGTVGTPDDTREAYSLG